VYLIKYNLDVATSFVSYSVPAGDLLNTTFPDINPAWLDFGIILNKMIFFFLRISIPQPPNSPSDVISSIRGMIKWYIILGCASLLCYWIGYSFWV